MTPFPQLNEEDFEQINLALKDLLEKSEASTALFVEKAGYLIAQQGDTEIFNTTELATLAANAFAATQFIADRLNETNFSSMFQQGEIANMLWVNVDVNSLVVIIFKAHLSVGAIKYYALSTVQTVANQLQIATLRAPDEGVDLAHFDPVDINDVFQRNRPSDDAPPEEPPPQIPPDEEKPPEGQPPKP
ncbi:MAG: hypothetical protein ACO1QS_16940 [Verrucomicrobiota bacterium]